MNKPTETDDSDSQVIDLTEGTATRIDTQGQTDIPNPAFPSSDPASAEILPPAASAIRADAAISSPVESTAPLRVSAPPRENSSLVTTGTIEATRHWLDLSGKMEKAKLFCQVMAGFELVALQKAIGSKHGNNQTRTSQIGKSYSQVLEELGLTQSTAYRLMDMAKVAAPRLKKLPELAGLDLSNTPLAALSAPQYEAMSTAVKKLTDGKTQGEFFDELYKGAGGKKKGGARPSGAKGNEDPAEAAELAKAAAINDWADIEGFLGSYGAAFVLLDDSMVEAQIAAMETLVTARRKWLATPAPDRSDAAQAIAKDLGSLTLE